MTVGGTGSIFINIFRGSCVSFGSQLSIISNGAPAYQKYNIASGSRLLAVGRGDIFPESMTEGTVDSTSSII